MINKNIVLLILTTVVVVSFLGLIATNTFNYVEEEIDGYNYRHVTEWSRTYPTTRSHIEKALEDGKITRHEYLDIYDVVERDPVRLEEDRALQNQAKDRLIGEFE